jgi:lysophospholipase L1-like esterase
MATDTPVREKAADGTRAFSVAHKSEIPATNKKRVTINASFLPNLVWLAGFFCLLLSSGGWSQEVPTGPERWEKQIAAFESEDAERPPEKGGIVFVGSSSIRLWKTLLTDFPEHHVLNRGFGGSQLCDLAHFADRLVLAYAPRFVVVYSGGNDINAGKTAEQVFESFRELVSKIRQRQPQTPIAYISIAGNPKRWAQVAEVIRANALIEIFTKQNEHLLYIDVFHPMLGADGLPRPDIFSPDRLHMNAAGYELWKRTVSPFLPKPEQP